MDVRALKPDGIEESMTEVRGEGSEGAFALIDSNSDGTINREEWETAVMNHVAGTGEAVLVDEGEQQGEVDHDVMADGAEHLVGGATLSCPNERELS